MRGTAQGSDRPRDQGIAPGDVTGLARELRCVVCQGLSVKDSPAESARQMRDLVVQRVAEGRTDQQIVDEFRASYGDWVILSPPLLSWSALVWLVPILAVPLPTAYYSGLTPGEAGQLLYLKTERGAFSGPPAKAALARFDLKERKEKVLLAGVHGFELAAGRKKVQAAIQGDQLRISSASKDDLQDAMRLLREQDFGIALQFGNYR